MSRTRLRIDRIDLDLRGLPRTTALAALPRFAPALQAALRVQPGAARAGGRVEAGRIDASQAGDATALARDLAVRVAAATRRG